MCSGNISSKYREKYEGDSSVIAREIERLNDLSGDEGARNVNEMLIEILDRKEIDKAMKQMNNSSPGEDGVRLWYVCGACEEVRVKVIEIVRIMFEKRTNE